MNIRSESEEVIKNFTILGQEIKLKESEKHSEIRPDVIVDFVNREVEEIKMSSPHINDNQASLLLCLKLAQEKLSLEEDYRENVNIFSEQINNILSIIEEVQPSEHH